ncbi:hypothetical protein F2P81_011319 [Scophthalmus maximus]|uniref:Uncharacterized protein n=1 Tax=Scophthalmus maximus TaxID=52904 RepID=A0A6A4SRI6_SCOMX|nr:hypothetical protein F2P81_011319 [Scophthalmus maximus]
MSVFSGVNIPLCPPSLYVSRNSAAAAAALGYRRTTAFAVFRRTLAQEHQQQVAGHELQQWYEKCRLAQFAARPWHWKRQMASDSARMVICGQWRSLDWMQQSRMAVCQSRSLASHHFSHFFVCERVRSTVPVAFICPLDIVLHSWSVISPLTQMSDFTHCLVVGRCCYAAVDVPSCSLVSSGAVGSRTDTCEGSVKRNEEHPHAPSTARTYSTNDVYLPGDTQGYASFASIENPVYFIETVTARAEFTSLLKNSEKSRTLVNSIHFGRCRASNQSQRIQFEEWTLSERWFDVIKFSTSNTANLFAVRTVKKEQRQRKKTHTHCAAVPEYIGLFSSSNQLEPGRRRSDARLLLASKNG